MACYHGHANIVSYFLNVIKLNGTAAPYLERGLYIALQQDQISVARCLLDHGTKCVKLYLPNFKISFNDLVALSHDYKQDFQVFFKMTQYRKEYAKYNNDMKLVLIEKMPRELADVILSYYDINVKPLSSLQKTFGSHIMNLLIS
jgi:hypothetical protein